jgi:hypothetical protein
MPCHIQQQQQQQQAQIAFSWRCVTGTGRTTAFSFIQRVSPRATACSCCITLGTSHAGILGTACSRSGALSSNSSNGVMNYSGGSSTSSRSS